jgi:hypothetical protein
LGKKKVMSRFEIAEIMEPYGTFTIKIVCSEKEAKEYCDEMNEKYSSIGNYYTYKKVNST